MLQHYKNVRYVEAATRWGSDDVDLGIHQPDCVNMKACRWIWVCVCLRHLDVRGRVGCQRNTEGENRTATHKYYTAQVYCVFLHNGDFSALISAKICCVSASVGNMNIHAVLLSLVKALCCSRKATVSNHFETWKDIDTGNYVIFISPGTWFIP